MPEQNPYPGHPDSNRQPPAASGMTTASMIIGIIAVALAFIPIIGFVSFILGPVALVLGIIALVKKRPRKGFALTGVITGAVALIVCIVYAIIAFAVANVMQNGVGESAPYTYTVSGEGHYTVKYLADDIDQLKTKDVAGGEFTQDVTANTMLGSLMATNDQGNTGKLSCTITQADGTIVVTKSASGEGAAVICLTYGETGQ